MPVITARDQTKSSSICSTAVVSSFAGATIKRTVLRTPKKACFIEVAESTRDALIGLIEVPPQIYGATSWSDASFEYAMIASQAEFIDELIHSRVQDQTTLVNAHYTGMAVYEMFSQKTVSVDSMLEILWAQCKEVSNEAAGLVEDKVTELLAEFGTIDINSEYNSELLCFVEQFIATHREANKLARNA